MQASSGLSGNAGIVRRIRRRVRSFFGPFACFDAGFLQKERSGGRICAGGRLRRHVSGPAQAAEAVAAAISG